MADLETHWNWVKRCPDYTGRQPVQDKGRTPDQ